MQQYPVVGLRYLAVFEKYIDDGFYCNAPAQINISWTKRSVCRQVYVHVCKQLGITLNDFDTDDIVEPSVIRGRVESENAPNRSAGNANAIRLPQTQVLVPKTSIFHKSQVNLSITEIIKALPISSFVVCVCIRHLNVFFKKKKNITIKKKKKSMVTEQSSLKRNANNSPVVSEIHYEKKEKDETVADIRQGNIETNLSLQMQADDVAANAENVHGWGQEKTAPRSNPQKWKNSVHLKVPTSLAKLHSITEASKSSYGRHTSVDTSVASGQSIESKNSPTLRAVPAPEHCISLETNIHAAAIIQEAEENKISVDEHKKPRLGFLAIRIEPSLLQQKHSRPSFEKPAQMSSNGVTKKKKPHLSLDNQKSQTSNTITSRTKSVFLMGKHMVVKPSQKAMSDHFMSDKYKKEELPLSLVMAIADALEQTLADVYENLTDPFSRFQKTKACLCDSVSVQCTKPLLCFLFLTLFAQLYNYKLFFFFLLNPISNRHSSSGLKHHNSDLLVVFFLCFLFFFFFFVFTTVILCKRFE
ncbi:hypothetical protein RFI_31412 [Reticulomyxa filosa]|uniref:Uncharacterized protein n=1 Tax=Reticulomyxa filosa TaxID=46433 RepID=X6LXB3_RETFI|nr:hypothetical protein RFI_31412 [Reticulomyxa filosa]|eukprot:ETO05986.1 hypothetical protein RFI_31412 [Reticulomyxa filosa]